MEGFIASVCVKLGSNVIPSKDCRPSFTSVGEEQGSGL
jgi:hypothetical protein